MSRVLDLLEEARSWEIAASGVLLTIIIQRKANRLDLQKVANTYRHAAKYIDEAVALLADNNPTSGEPPKHD